MTNDELKLYAEAFRTAYSYDFDRIKAANVRMRANDNLSSEFLEPWSMQRLETDVGMAVAALLKALCIDINEDHNTENTAQRVAKMFVREVMRGRFEPPPDITAFPNDLKLDELYITGPITVRSMCSHHLVPIIGRAWIGVIPGEDSVIGLSKFNRLVDWVFARPQIQEEATIQLADILEEKCKPKGLAIVVKASHLCMTWRGVREALDATMTTSVMRGAMRGNQAARSEFLSLVGVA